MMRILIKSLVSTVLVALWLSYIDVPTWGDVAFGLVLGLSWG